MLYKHHSKISSDIGIRYKRVVVLSHLKPFNKVLDGFNFFFCMIKLQQKEAPSQGVFRILYPMRSVASFKFISFPVFTIDPASLFSPDKNS